MKEITISKETAINVIKAICKYDSYVNAKTEKILQDNGFVNGFDNGVWDDAIQSLTALQINYLFQCIS
jgi:hypothetical protein